MSILSNFIWTKIEHKCWYEMNSAASINDLQFYKKQSFRNLISSSSFGQYNFWISLEVFMHVAYKFNIFNGPISKYLLGIMEVRIVNFIDSYSSSGRIVHIRMNWLTEVSKEWVDVNMQFAIEFKRSNACDAKHNWL